jgi:hypothetical protein
LGNLSPVSPLTELPEALLEITGFSCRFILHCRKIFKPLRYSLYAAEEMGLAPDLRESKLQRSVAIPVRIIGILVKGPFCCVHVIELLHLEEEPAVFSLKLRLYETVAASQQFPINIDDYLVFTY